METIESLADEVATLKTEVAKKADKDYINESFNSILQYVNSASVSNSEMFNNLSNMISDLYALISAWKQGLQSGRSSFMSFKRENYFMM